MSVFFHKEKVNEERAMQVTEQENNSVSYYWNNVGRSSAAALFSFEIQRLSPPFSLSH